MALTQAATDGIVDDFAEKLAFLAIYEEKPIEDIGFHTPLVVQALAGFQPAVNGVAVANDLGPTQIEQSGTARWARMTSIDGLVLLLVRVRDLNDPDAEPGDVLVDRTDFHRGGLLTLARVTVTVPQ